MTARKSCDCKRIANIESRRAGRAENRSHLTLRLHRPSRPSRQGRRAAADPDWLLADRLVGLRAFGTLPMRPIRSTRRTSICENARLADVRPCTARRGRDGTPGRAASPMERPHTLNRRGSMSALVLSAEARAAGVILETPPTCGPRPGCSGSCGRQGCALPENDKLGPDERGRLVRSAPCPERRSSGRPVVLRWKVGGARKGSLLRTVIPWARTLGLGRRGTGLRRVSADGSDASERRPLAADRGVVGAGF